MTATSLDLSQIRTDALSSAETFRTLIGLGSGDTPTFKGATLSTGTITASTPAVDISQTWNNSGVTFTGSKINITDTASASESIIADYQLGGVSQFAITKGGTSGIGYPAGFRIKTPNYQMYWDTGAGGLLFRNSADSSYVNLYCNHVGSTGFLYGSGVITDALEVVNLSWRGAEQAVNLKGSVGITWNNGATFTSPDLTLVRDGAGILAQRRTTNAQTFRIYNTYTDASNYERGFMRWNSNVFEIGSEKAGTGVTRGTKIILNSDAQAYIDCSDNGYVANFVTRYGTAFSIANAGVVFSRNITMGFEGRCLNITTSGFNSTPSHIAGNTVGDAHFRIGPGWSNYPNAGWYKFLSAYGATPASAGAGGDGGGMSIWLGQGGTANGAFSDGADGSFNLLTTTRTGTVNTSPLFTIDYSGKVTVNNTYTNASNYERGKLEWSSDVFRIGTEKAGTGSARALELQTDGTTRLTIGTTGNTTIANGYLYFQDSNGYITRTSGTNSMNFSASSGTIHASLSAAWFTLNNFGVQGADGINITFRAIDRGGNSGAGLTATLRGGNGSWATTGSIGGHVYVFGGDALGTGNNNGGFVYIDGGLNTGSGSIGDVVIGNTRGNLQLADARNVILGTTTGTKIGTATTQKLGFYNATPVVQPTAVADATDAASVITQLNALLSRMRDIGLIAT